jgi:L-threonylcarbamoyladenylate synthase
MMETQVFSAAPESIRKVADLLKNGEVVALPTETVYGLAGNALSPASVLKIFAAKERPSFDPLIVHVSDRSLQSSEGMLQPLVNQKIISADVLQWSCRPEIEKAMTHFWPGPLTFILPRGSMIPDEVTSGQNTVGLRCPDHKLFQAVLANLDFPLAAPSANRFGRISPTQAKHVVQELDGRIAGILDGGTCSVGVESTIIRIEDPLKVTLLRPGKIGAAELEAHFKTKLQVQSTLGEQNQAQVAPGMLDEHYAPRKPLILIPASFENENETLAILAKYPESDRHAYLAMNTLPKFIQSRKHAVMKTLSDENSLEEMAQRLFATLRELDHHSNVEMIFCDLPTDAKSGLALAIRDRLKRASRNKPLI